MAVYGIADDSVYAGSMHHGSPAPSPITTGSASNWEQSTEALIAADPQIILLGDGAYGMTADAVAARPGWDVLYRGQGRGDHAGRRHRRHATRPAARRWPARAGQGASTRTPSCRRSRRSTP